MRNYWKTVLVAFCLVLFTGASSFEHNHELCFPENDLYISHTIKNTTGMNEEVFNHVINVVEDIYTPVIKELGGKLLIERKWTDGTVNAYAQRVGNTYKVSMFGGLARHRTITPEGFALVVCHEIGHHIGGAPKKPTWGGALSWASNEGQADYWGATKCMKKVMDVLEEYPGDTVSEDYLFAKEECSKRYELEQDQVVCLRTAMAGKSLAELFRALRNQTTEIHFSTKDPAVVTATNHNHPASQCRMDTYFAGSLCNKGEDEEISDKDPKKGFCSRKEDLVEESRPLCWFKP